MISYVVDRFKGYFDNLRSDGFFQSQAQVSYSASRIKGWTDRHFLLVNSTSFTKDQVQELGDRVQLWNSAQIQPQLGALSKKQIVILQNQTDYIPYFKPTKVYKLILSGRVQTDNFIHSAWDSFAADANRRAILLQYITPSFVNETTKLNHDEFLTLLKRDFSIIKFLKPEWVTKELGDYVASTLSHTALLLEIQDDTAREKLYYEGMMYANWGRYQAALKSDVEEGRFDRLSKHPQKTLQEHLAFSLEEYLLFKPFTKFSFKVSNSVFSRTWAKASTKLKHALKGMIDQPLFKYLMIDHPSNLFEILGDDEYFKFIKAEPEILKRYWDFDNFLKSQFLQKYNLSDLIEHIGIEALSDNDLKILIERDPLYFVKSQLKIAERHQAFIINACIHKGIPLSELPKEFTISNEDISNKAVIEKLEDKMTALEKYRAIDYVIAKDELKRELEKTTLKGEKIDALKKRYKVLNDLDEEIIITAYHTYLAVNNSEIEKAANEKLLLKLDSEHGITTILDLKEFGLYAATPTGGHDLKTIFNNLIKLAGTKN